MQGVRIWVVEDDPRVLAGVLAGLERAGHDARGFADPRAALAALSEPQATMPALLLTDVLMPGLNGGELARAARAVHPALRVLLMSGDVGATDAALLAPFPLLDKPFTPAALRVAIDAVLA